MGGVLTRARRLDPRARLVPDCVVNVTPDVLARAAPEHVALGCAPSKNAYGDGALVGSIDGALLQERSAGCHMHFGCIPFDAKPVVRALDAIYGIASIALLARLEHPARRAFYGRAGEYRLPPHGLEYRVPSSATLVHPVVTHLSFDLARVAVNMGYRSVAIDWVDERETQRIINELDVDAARRVLSANKGVYQHVLKTMGMYLHNDWMSEMAWRLLTEGASACLDLSDMHAAWCLTSGREWAVHSEAENASLAKVVFKKGAG